MKPTVDEDEILVGAAAATHLCDNWQNVGAGMVEVEVIGPWLIVSRKGGDYRAFISCVDSQMVTILDGEATTRHIPKEYRPDEDIPEDRYEALGAAFEHSAGMYPMDNLGVFQMGFKPPEGDHQALRVGLLDGSFGVVDEP